MNASDVYKAKLEEASRLEGRLAKATGEDRRERLSDGIDEAELDAENVAHCVALWGDIDLERADFDALLKEVEGKSLGGCQRWRFGVEVLRAAAQN
ncbi:hypothetical protein DFR29_104134 [Tahibacter aquaticus]|uniref:Uncharacterized protein n=2 Tax=Tahibacter aquaticus TaxID=520092 RepID=A0A4V3DMS1_9GAMM|nr:hypothetical protein DFR29_104134 [Tahibacter aquaticus]